MGKDFEFEVDEMPEEGRIGNGKIDVETGERLGREG